jgi:predicted adenylyl cyclase CyaB
VSDAARARRNVECKWRARTSLAELRARAVAAGAEDRGLLLQTDTFFAAPLARLKLRELGEGRAELISYRRADVASARASDYRVVPVADGRALALALGEALGTTGQVVKRRQLLLRGHTRIHLDEVEGLGAFVELETVLSGEDEAEAHRELEALARDLGLDAGDALAVPYLELLAGPARH